MKRQEQGHQDSQAISKEELPKEAYQSILQDITAREAFINARRSLKDIAKLEEPHWTKRSCRRKHKERRHIRVIRSHWRSNECT